MDPNPQHQTANTAGAQIFTMMNAMTNSTSLVGSLMARLEEMFRMLAADEARGRGVFRLVEGMRGLLGKSLAHTDSRIDRLELALQKVQAQATATDCENARLRERVAASEKRTAQLERELKRQREVLAPKPPLHPQKVSNPNSPGSPRRASRERRRII